MREAGSVPAARSAAEAYGHAFQFRHLFPEDGNGKFMIASLRYLDTFAKIDGGWYFAERKLILDWSETRTSTP